MPPETQCELCEAARFTEWYYEDEECWCAECEACRVPMVVWKSHDPAPPPEVRERLISVLSAVATQLGFTRWVLDDVMRTIPDHFHVHARPIPSGVPGIPNSHLP